MCREKGGGEFGKALNERERGERDWVKRLKPNIRCEKKYKNKFLHKHDAVVICNLKQSSSENAVRILKILLCA